MKIKNYAILFLTGTLFMGMFTYGYAYDKDRIEKLPPGYVEMIENIFKNQESLIVLDNKGTDIKIKFLEDSYEYFSSGDYINIRNYIMDEVSEISYLSKEIDLSSGKALQQNKYVENFFYKLVNDVSGKFPTKEISYYLGGTITYDQNTEQVVRATNPTFKIYQMNFGSSFSPYIDSLTLNSSVSNGRGYFSANFTVRATLQVPLLGLPIGFNINYGNHFSSFYGTP